MRKIAIIGVVLVCALAVVAEDVTFLNNRRQWEQLPTATLMHMGNDFMNVKNLPDSALLCFSLIANRYNENLKGEELKQCIRAHCWIGKINVDCFANYTEGYKYLLRAQDLAEKHHYDKFLPDVFNLLGNFYWVQEEFERGDQCYMEALAYHKKSFWKTIELKEYDKLPVDFVNLIYIAFDMDELMQITKEREIYRNLSIPDTAELKFASEAMNEGVELFTKGHLEEALITFRQALSKNKTTSPSNTAPLQVMIDMFVYNTLLQLNRNEDALAILEHSREVLQSELPNLMPGIYKEFAKYYRRQHNQPLADKYELLWRRSKDSIAQATQANSVNTARFLHEIDKMNEEQQALVVKQRHDRQMLWIVGAAALVAIVLLVLLYINRQRIQENYRQLYEKNQALLAAEDARLQAADTEQVTEVVPKAPKYSHNQMDDDVMDELWLQIKRVMETSREIYDEQFTIEQMAELIGAKKNYVSQTINTKTGQAFSVLLNVYRIREACRRMNDHENYGNFSVEGIAQSVGYGSRSHFAKLFKAATGVPPSTYMKMCKERTSPAPSSQREAD